MAPEMLCKLPKVSSIDNFEDLLEDMEIDEGLLRELLEEVNDNNVEQMSMMENVVNEMMPHSKEKNDHDSFHVLPDNESQLVLYQDKQIQDLDYWITQQIGEMPCSSFQGLWFENEMMPFWNLENRIEDVMMVDDIAYVELWEDSN